jgi:cytochrome P450
MLSFITLVLCALVFYVVYKCYVYPRYVSPLRNLAGPPPGSIPFLGNMPEIFSSDLGVAHHKWLKEYGPVYRVNGFFNEPNVFVADPALVQYIVGKQPYLYVKPDALQKGFEMVTGRGLLTSDGVEHKRQKKYLQETFNYRNVKEMAPTIHAVTQQLVTKWKLMVKQGATSLVVDDDVSKATLDIIGQVGFGYHFNALDHDSQANPLLNAYQLALNAPRGILNVVGFFFPKTRAYIPYFQRMDTALETVNEILVDLIRKRWHEIEQGENVGTDLLSVIMQHITEEGDTSITEDEIKSQAMTFAVAGHETTATAFAWTIHVLSQETKTQERLRAELKAYFPQGLQVAPSADELSKLPYLDMVVKEMLRLYVPAPTTLRCAKTDDTLPNGLFIPAGTKVSILKTVMHTLPSVWGEDAQEFRPERWNELDAAKIPYFASTYFPFLTGARGCIGQKLALLELKMLIASVFNEFLFSPVSGHAVHRKFGIVNKPLPFVHVHIRPV